MSPAIRCPRDVPDGPDGSGWIRMVSGWCPDGFRMVSGWLIFIFLFLNNSVKSGWFAGWCPDAPDGSGWCPDGA